MTDRRILSRNCILERGVAAERCSDRPRARMPVNQMGGMCRQVDVGDPVAARPALLCADPECIHPCRIPHCSAGQCHAFAVLPTAKDARAAPAHIDVDKGK